MGLITRILCGILALNLYGMSAYVSDVDVAEDMVEFTDYATEHTWWTEGNSAEFSMWQDVVLIMHDNFTAEKYDDIIITISPENFGAEIEMKRRCGK